MNTNKNNDNISKHSTISNESTQFTDQLQQQPDMLLTAEMQPPFLVKTRTQEERESMRQELKRQETMRKERVGPYDWLHRLYARVSTSFILENKAAVARDHLANERTYLAWLRTSLSLITVGVAITQLYHLTPTNHYAKAGKSLGAAFVVFSILFLWLALTRYFHTQVALTKNQFPASRGSVLFGSTCILAVLIAMFVVIILDLQ